MTARECLEEMGFNVYAARGHDGNALMTPDKVQQFVLDHLYTGISFTAPQLADAAQAWIAESD